MSTYYVAPSGSDTNPGTAAQPWRTTTRVNTAATGQLGLRDQVLYQRGGTYYGLLRTPLTLDPALPGWLRIGAYGSGTPPILSGYKILTTASGWVQHDATTWRIDLAASGAGTRYSGYDDAQGGGGNVGHLVVDGVVHGRRRFSLATLAAAWDFYCSGTVLYVRATANPTTLATSIRAAVDGHGVTLQSGTWLADVRVEGFGGHGAMVPGLGSERVRVTNCEIDQVGGSVLTGYGDGTTRYGNGVEGWIGTRDLQVTHCRIRDVYDVALTLQGGEAAQAGGWEDVLFRRNLIYRCSQGIEFWSGGANGSDGFSNVRAVRNTVLYSGYGWGGDVRPNTDQRVHLLTYGWSRPADILVRRNVFWDARSAYRYTQVEPAGLVCDRNIIALRAGRKMSWQDTETIEQASAWAAVDGRDTTSRFVALPADASTVVPDSAIAAALTQLDELDDGQVVGGRAIPIHAPWR